MNAATYALLGTLLGVALGYVGQYVLAYRRERAERRLAHEGRLYASRSGVYVELLKARNRQVVTVARTHPLLSAGPMPKPEPLSLDAAIDLGATVDALNSPAVREADELLGKAINDFHFQVWGYERKTRQTGTEPVISTDHYPAVQEKRDEINALYDALVAAVQAELLAAP